MLVPIDALNGSFVFRVTSLGLQVPNIRFILTSLRLLATHYFPLTTHYSLLFAASTLKQPYHRFLFHCCRVSPYFGVIAFTSCRPLAGSTGSAGRTARYCFTIGSTSTRQTRIPGLQDGGFSQPSALRGHFRSFVPRLTRVTSSAALPARSAGAMDDCDRTGGLACTSPVTPKKEPNPNRASARPATFGEREELRCCFMMSLLL